MKIYDKEIYKTDQSIKACLIGALIFLLGFGTGFIAEKKEVEQQNVVQEVIEIDEGGNVNDNSKSK